MSNVTKLTINFTVITVLFGLWLTVVVKQGPTGEIGLTGRTGLKGDRGGN